MDTDVTGENNDKSDILSQMEAIVAEHETALLRYATRILDNPAAAEDVVQNVFVKLFEKWKKGSRSSDKLRSWLYRVIHNEAVDFIRSESRLAVLHKKQAEEAAVCLDDVHCPENEADRRTMVLEHVRKNEFVDTVRECWRLLKPGGVCTHVVDYKDHLEESLNNLRFSDRLWEADWMASSGFYTNRIRFGEMLQIFEKQGFEITVLDKKEWPNVPIPKKYMHPRFRVMPDSDLKVSGAIVRLYKRNG